MCVCVVAFFVVVVLCVFVFSNGLQQMACLWYVRAGQPIVLFKRSLPGGALALKTYTTRSQSN
jgi:hypothetical protein